MTFPDATLKLLIDCAVASEGKLILAFWKLAQISPGEAG
jgi:hypothetical protein